MIIRWLLAIVHLLALPLGLAGVWARARALRGRLDQSGLERVFVADAMWGIAAVLWLGTGVWRWLGGTEKATAYYADHRMFHVKIGLFLLILLLEITPMVALVRWRIALRRGEVPRTGRATLYARISVLQAAIVILMVAAATALARGISPL